MRLSRNLAFLLMVLVALPLFAWTTEPVIPNVSFTAAGDANVTGVVVTDYSYATGSGNVMHISVSMTGNLSEAAPELYVNIPGAMRSNRSHRSGGVNLTVGNARPDAEWSTAGTQIVIKRRDGQQITAGPVSVDFVIAIDASPRSSTPPTDTDL